MKVFYSNHLFIIGVQVGRMGCVPACGGNGNSRNASCSKPGLHFRKRPWEGALYKWLTRSASDAMHMALYKWTTKIITTIIPFAQYADDIDEKQLRSISSPPQLKDQNYWTAPDFTGLSTILKKVQNATCYSPAINETGVPRSVRMQFPASVPWIFYRF